jgi:dTDP-glucose 4,6-dehydratase
MVINCINQKELPVYGDGRQIRDWLHVSDHCAAIARVLEDGAAGEVYNIGGDNEWANIDIVTLVGRLVDRRLERPEGTSASLIRHVKDRPGHDRRYAMDAAKIERELGWRPAYTFERGIEETIDWYLAHEDWWRRIVSGEYRSFYESWYGDR